MRYTAETLGQLKRAVESLIEELGPDTPVGGGYKPSDRGHMVDDHVSLDWVICDKTTGEIQGTEADDDEQRLKDNQVNVIRIK